MTDGFEFDWLKDVEAALAGKEPDEVPDPEPEEEVHYMSEAAAIFNDPDRYEEGMYPLPFTDWHPPAQSVEPEPEVEERDAYEGYNDPPPPPGDLENFVNDVGEFLSDPIGSIFHGLFG